MGLLRVFLTALAALSASFGSGAAASPSRVDDARCEALAHLAIGPAARIIATSVEARVPSFPDVNWAGPTPATAGPSSTAFCKFIAYGMPASTSHIRVEVWLPMLSWNGRMLGIGNGGYPDTIDYPAMSAGLVRGFAVVSTDMGLAAYLPHGKALPGTDVTDVFIGNPIAIRDFATRSTHDMTVIGKQVVQAFYRRPAIWSYFAGCSTGGMQGMSESQRYPHDYDAILAGDPGGNRVRIHLAILWDVLAAWHRPEGVITDAKLTMLHDAAVVECLRQMGERAGRRFLAMPQDCRWDPGILLCRAEENPSCLTESQLATAVAIYGGPRNPRTGAAYYHGLLPGSELGWSFYMSAWDKPDIPYFGVFRAALGRSLSPSTFDWDRDAQSFIDVMAPQLDSADPDIATFAESGGKLLFYTGSSDAIVPLTDISGYVRSAIPSHAASTPKSLDDAVRLFVIAGMDHCRGGRGNDHFDGLSMIQRWREQGIAPFWTADRH